MTNKTFVFKMTPDALELFFQLCHEMNATSEEERVKILATMGRLGLLDSISSTSRTKEQLVKDWSEHFNVMDMTKKEGDDDGDSKTSS